MKINNQLPNNLPQLQNLIKKDPQSYYEEFVQQYRHFQSRLEVFQLQPSEYSKPLDESVMFLAQVSHCYRNELAEYHENLMQILKTYATVMDPEMRTTVCKALVLMRNKNLVAPAKLLELFFQMLNCHDKALRKFLQTHIITDIKNVNSKHKNAKLNRDLQNFMFSMLKDSFSTASKMSLDIMIELYRKNIWNDAKTVNVIAIALFSKINRVFVAALTFFLGRDEEDKKKDSDDSSDDDTPDAKEVAMANRVNKKSRKRQKKLQAAKKVIKKHQSQKKAPIFNFSALHLIHDPQDLAEKLLERLQVKNEKYEVRLLAMNLISRLIGIHQLHVLNFYPTLIKYLEPHKPEVTKCLVFAAQSAHELMPPYVIEDVLKAIADKFVAEYNSHEVIAVGLNTIREICARCPLAMYDELLNDISRHKSSKNKSIAMAARSVIQLYRVVNPSLLHKKDKGRPTAGAAEGALEFGQVSAKDYIPGTEILPEETEEPKAGKEADGWESTSEEEDDESDGEWVDVIHSDDEQAKPEAEALTEEERKEKAAVVSQGRILSQEEFQKVRVNQLAKLIDSSKGKGGGKKRKPEENMELFEKKELVSLSEIERIHKRPRHDKESRLATVQAGREGRDTFAKVFRRMNPHASTSNKEKAKNKAFSMIRHKMKKKNKRSFRDKQIALRNALIKQKKMK